MLINGVTWKDYVILREALDTPGLRMTYCEGTLELMSPSLAHEVDKKSIARLVELYAFLRRLRLQRLRGRPERPKAPDPNTQAPDDPTSR